MSVISVLCGEQQTRSQTGGLTPQTANQDPVVTVPASRDALLTVSLTPGITVHIIPVCFYKQASSADVTITVIMWSTGNYLLCPLRAC